MIDIRKKLNEFRSMLKIPRLSTRSFFAYYLPVAGTLSHTIYTVHIFTPELMARAMKTHDLAFECSLLCTATLGPGFYAYYRPHMHALGKWNRVQYSAFISIMFTYGSLFAAVLIKDILPSSLNVWMRSVIAAGLSCLLLSRGYNYLNYIDARTNNILQNEASNGSALQQS